MEITENSSLEEMFNAFISDEMWAALSYKNAAFVSKGKALKYSNGIFNDNSDEEFEHMEELVDMAKSLGIVVSFDLSDMQNNCTTPYGPLNPDEDTGRLVEMFIDAEKKAIAGYETALKSEAVKEKPELCQFFGEICNDEHAHLTELEDCYSNIVPEGERLSKMDSDDEHNSDDSENSEEKNASDEFSSEDASTEVDDKSIENDDSDEKTPEDDSDDEDDDENEDEDDEDDFDEYDESAITESFETQHRVSMVGLYKNAFESVVG